MPPAVARVTGGWPSREISRTWAGTGVFARGGSSGNTPSRAGVVVRVGPDSRATSIDETLRSSDIFDDFDDASAPPVPSTAVGTATGPEVEEAAACEPVVRGADTGSGGPPTRVVSSEKSGSASAICVRSLSSTATGADGEPPSVGDGVAGAFAAGSTTAAIGGAVMRADGAVGRGPADEPPAAGVPSAARLPVLSRPSALCDSDVGSAPAPVRAGAGVPAPTGMGGGVRPGTIGGGTGCPGVVDISGLTPELSAPRAGEPKGRVEPAVIGWPPPAEEPGKGPMPVPPSDAGRPGPR